MKLSLAKFMIYTVAKAIHIFKLFLNIFPCSKQTLHEIERQQTVFSWSIYPLTWTEYWDIQMTVTLELGTFSDVRAQFIRVKKLSFFEIKVTNHTQGKSLFNIKIFQLISNFPCFSFIRYRDCVLKTHTECPDEIAYLHIFFFFRGYFLRFQTLRTVTNSIVYR